MCFSVCWSNPAVVGGVVDAGPLGPADLCRALGGSREPKRALIRRPSSGRHGGCVDNCSSASDI